MARGNTLCLFPVARHIHPEARSTRVRGPSNSRYQWPEASSTVRQNRTCSVVQRPRCVVQCLHAALSVGCRFHTATESVQRGSEIVRPLASAREVVRENSRSTEHLIAGDRRGWGQGCVVVCASVPVPAPVRRGIVAFFVPCLHSMHSMHNGGGASAHLAPTDKAAMRQRKPQQDGT